MTGKRLTTLAQKLRREPTEAQKRLWSRLRRRQLGLQFTREFQVAGFICDFACRNARLIVELDGGQHAESEADVERTQIIELHGYTVIRFWNNEVLSNTDGVVLSIVQSLAAARNRSDWFGDEG